MDTEEKDDLYARWLSGELTPAEKQQLEESGELAVLDAVVKTVDSWSLPPLKKNTLEKIKERLAEKQVKVIPLYRKPKVWAVAASVATLITLGLYFFNRTAEKQMVELACGAGQTKTFALPDSTSVTLSGNSTLAYDAGSFSTERKVELKGEGYFQVFRKGPFEVRATNGIVNVTGTKFIILSSADIYSVRCYEGSVNVAIAGKIFGLKKGDGIRKIASSAAEAYAVKDSIYNSFAGDERFEDTPLREVCASLEQYYNITIDKRNAGLDRRFSGSYRKTNLDTALLMVFNPMGIAYKKEGNTVVLEKK